MGELVSFTETRGCSLVYNMLYNILDNNVASSSIYSLNGSNVNEIQPIKKFSLPKDTHLSVKSHILFLDLNCNSGNCRSLLEKKDRNTQ